MVAVLTAADLAADSVGPIPYFCTIAGPEGGSVSVPPCHGLAGDRVRHVGEPLACVIARDVHLAKDGVERIEVDYQALDHLIDSLEAVGEKAVQLWPEAPGNVAALYEIGDSNRCQAAIAAADHVVTLTLTNNRIVVHPMEPRCSIACVEPESGRLKLLCGSQAAHLSRDLLAQALKLPKDDLLLEVQDVGGGFGARITPYREDLVLLAAARRLGRTVRWRAERSEAFLSDTQGRDQASRVTLALRGDGRIEAYRADILANLGATPSPFGLPIVSTTGHRVVTGVYDIQNVYLRLRCVLTNTVPTGPYRGAGRPETIHRLERLLDVAAARLGLDPVTIRRRNMIRPGRMPYENAAGWSYDSGDFPAILETCLRLADWSGFHVRQAESRARGLLRGRGIACHIDTTSGISLEEEATLRLDGEGLVTIGSGTQAIGQGLFTAYAQIVAAELGLSLDRVRLLQGRTDSVARGGGTYGSRSLYLGGSAVRAVAKELAAQVLELASQALETEVADLLLEANSVRVAGTDRQVSLSQIAERCPGRAVFARATQEAPYSFPNGCCIAEVEIEPDTGVVRVDRLFTLDDVGRVVNPLLVAGQMHGGIAQGIGQALLEGAVYDRQSGQPLTGSLMDYGLPRADFVPPLTCHHDESYPTETNTLGAKGAGESGAVGTPPAVVSAVVDALSPFGVEHMDMPISSEEIWRLLAERSN
ncbi:MAG: xanthine dehydrogenase family protein molybdopterin-binding subunit [Rhodospirillales bacterium]